MTTFQSNLKSNSASKNKKNPPGSKKQLMQEIQIPSDEKWKEEFESFGFSLAQERELEETITDIHSRIINYNLAIQDLPLRSERKKELVAFEKLLRKLRECLEAFGDDIDNILPSEMRAQIGLLSDFLTAEEAFGDKTYSKRADQKLEQAVFLRCALNLEKIENELRHSRESMGLQVGGKIMRNFIQKVHDPLREWVELERLNKGGAPANMTVRLIVHELACAAPGIIGKRAAIKKDGPFVRLCSAVLRACGLPDEGDNVGNIVPGVVKKVRGR